MLRETERTTLGVSPGRTVGEETWQRNEEVQECMQIKRLAQRKWDFHARRGSEEGENDETQGWKRCAGKKLG